jgi:hypothetical protein
MEKEQPHLSFEQWVAFVFDHPLPNPGQPNWYHDVNALGDDDVWWDISAYPQTTIAYLIMLFENAPVVLAPFSEAQINQGLWYLVNNSCSDHMFALLDTRVSWPERKRCLFAIFTLFERFFAPRCSPHLSHLDTLESDTDHVSPLNLICYMWWDILPLYGQPQVPGRQEIDAACLEVMRLTLDLEVDACRESALHGLGHWAHEYRQQVETTINAWLARHQELEEELKAYAFAARRGRVL